MRPSKTFSHEKLIDPRLYDDELKDLIGKINFLLIRIAEIDWENATVVGMLFDYLSKERKKDVSNN